MAVPLHTTQKQLLKCWPLLTFSNKQLLAMVLGVCRVLIVERQCCCYFACFVGAPNQNLGLGRLLQQVAKSSLIVSVLLYTIWVTVGLILACCTSRAFLCVAETVARWWFSIFILIYMFLLYCNETPKCYFIAHLFTLSSGKFGWLWLSQEPSPVAGCKTVEWPHFCKHYKSNWLHAVL